jgi:hypothetical protein
VLEREVRSAAEGLDPSLTNLLSLPRVNSVLSRIVFMIGLTTRVRADALKSGNQVRSRSVSVTKVDVSTGALNGRVLGWMSILGAPLKLSRRGGSHELYVGQSGKRECECVGVCVQRARASWQAGEE